MSLNDTLAGSWVIGTWRKCIPTTVGARISAQILFLHPLRMAREARMGNIAEIPHIPCLGFSKNGISLPLGTSTLLPTVRMSDSLCGSCSALHSSAYRLIDDAGQVDEGSSGQ